MKWVPFAWQRKNCLNQRHFHGFQSKTLPFVNMSFFLWIKCTLHRLSPFSLCDSTQTDLKATIWKKNPETLFHISNCYTCSKNGDRYTYKQAACVSPRSDKYVADTLQKLPHPPTSVSSYCSCAQKKTKKQRVAKGCELGGVAPWEHTGLGSMSPFMPHSFTLSPH